MEKEILENLKIQVENNKKEIESNNEELKRLEQLPAVKRYIELLERQQSITHTTMMFNDFVIDDIIANQIDGTIKETNDLWFLFGFYDDFDEYFKDFFDYDNPNYDFFVYINLETMEKMNLEASKKDKFESKHKIVNKVPQRSWNLFYEMRHKFFKMCITDDQEIAVKKVIERKK